MQSDIPQKWLNFIARCIDCEPELLVIEKIAGDGSSRDFFRIESDLERFILMANPAPPESGGVDENESFSYVAGVLNDSGVRVPEIFDFDDEEGIFLLEDFGDRHLQGHVLDNGDNRAEIIKSYRELIDILLRIQNETTGRFEPARVFNPEYDREFMYEKEALYFAEHYVRGLCAGTEGSGKFGSELRELSQAAAGKMAGKVFLYRDFQSRNIMLLDEAGGISRWGLLDFQGARLGPRSYDLASLIYDPYVELSANIRAELLEYYLAELKDSTLAEKIREEFPLVAAHRMMQVLGAYGKLSSSDGKTDFLKYVGPAVRGMNQLFERFESLESYRLLREFMN